MNNLEMIDSIMVKYKMDHAIPDSARSEIIKLKKTILVNILKSAGKYTLFTAVIINLLIIAKKFGLGISAAKMNIAVKAVIIFTTSSAAITTGTVIYHHSIKNPQPEIMAADQAGSSENEKSDTPASEEIPSYKFEIIPLSSPPELSQESKDLLKNMFDTIIQNYGNQSAVISGKDNRYHAKYILCGTFSKLGDSYYVSVRLVNAADSRIISIINKNASNVDDIKKIPGEIISEFPGLKLK